MQEHSQGDLILEEDDGPYEKGNILRSFHHQAPRPMSRKALLVGFLLVWLKRRVVPSSSGNVILPTVSRSSSPRSFLWTSPDDGVLYSAGPSCIDGGFL